MPENKPTQAEIVSAFVEKMMADKGVEDATLRAELEAKLEEQIEQTMIRTLPDEKLGELEEMLGREASDEEIENFFNEAGVDFQAAVEQAMLAFREAFLNSGEEV